MRWLLGRFLGIFVDGIAGFFRRKVELARERRTGTEIGKVQGADWAAKELTKRREEEVAADYQDKPPTADELNDLFGRKS